MNRWTDTLHFRYLVTNGKVKSATGGKQIAQQTVPAAQELTFIFRCQPSTGTWARICNRLNQVSVWVRLVYFKSNFTTVPVTNFSQWHANKRYPLLIIIQAERLHPQSQWRPCRGHQVVTRVAMEFLKVMVKKTKVLTREEQQCLSVHEDQPTSWSPIGTHSVSSHRNLFQTCWNNDCLL